jgi:hypothetical protein
MVIITASFFTQFLWAAPKLDQSKAKAGDCTTCHGNEKVLPDGHPDTKSMNLAACKTCHTKDKSVLPGKIRGSHIHQLAGINCISCHGKEAKPEALTMEECVACHGSTDKLAGKTQNVKPANPHTSPHYGTNLDCNLCHHQHSKSENYCAGCHNFNFQTP